MGLCGRNSVILDNLTVDVITDFDVSDWETGNDGSITKQCLIEDNPGRITILPLHDPSEARADIVVVIKGKKEFPFGWLARAIKALDDSHGLQSVTYDNAVVYWR